MIDHKGLFIAPNNWLAQKQVTVPFSWKISIFIVQFLGESFLVDFLKNGQAIGKVLES